MFGLDFAIPTRPTNSKIRKAIAPKVAEIQKLVQSFFNFNKKSHVSVDQSWEVRYTQLQAELATKCIQQSKSIDERNGMGDIVLIKASFTYL